MHSVNNVLHVHKFQDPVFNVAKKAPLVDVVILNLEVGWFHV